MDEDEEQKAQPKLLAQREAVKDEEELQAKRIQREAIQEDEEQKAQPKLLAQREAVKDEEEIQAKRIQREAMEEDEEQKAQPKLLAQREAKVDEEELQAKRIQREAMEEDEEQKAQPKLLAQREATQAAEGFAASADFEKRLRNLRTSGKPLPAKTLAFMEARFGVDFSEVRIHTDAEAVKLAREINAQAFTQGQDIYLGEGNENVESEAGKRLLAHELTHVVQQTGAKKKK
jgi:hypothetical protein